MKSIIYIGIRGHINSDIIANGLNEIGMATYYIRFEVNISNICFIYRTIRRLNDF